VLIVDDMASPDPNAAQFDHRRAEACMYAGWRMRAVREIDRGGFGFRVASGIAGVFAAFDLRTMGVPR
jgi:hypothetical protein